MLWALFYSYWRVQLALGYRPRRLRQVKLACSREREYGEQQPRFFKIVASSSMCSISGLELKQLVFFGLHGVHSYDCCAQQGLDSFTVMGINCNANTDGKRWSHPVIGNAVTDSLRRMIGRLCVCFR